MTDTIKKCEFCDCPLEIRINEHQVMRYNGHTDGYCRAMTKHRINLLQGMLRSQSLDLQRSEHVRNDVLSIFDWLTRDAGRVRELYDAMMGDVKLDAINWCNDQMRPTREEKLRQLQAYAQAGIELKLPDGALKELLGE